MISNAITGDTPQVAPCSIVVHMGTGGAPQHESKGWSSELRTLSARSLPHSPNWLTVLNHGLGHVPYWLEASAGNVIEGVLPLAFVKSWLFGRFLVSLPYLNSGGVLATSEPVATALVDRAVQLADELDVRYLELRHETELLHDALRDRLSTKVHMRLALPERAEVLWKQLKDKVRNQVRKGEKQGFDVAWGGESLLPGFYEVFSRNMRDLGTPVYPQRLFQEILSAFGDRAEVCVVRDAQKPISAALLVHGEGKTEIPSASSLRSYNTTNVNMLMYWQLLQRAIARGQQIFDFGRSTVDSSTYRFKKQWGAQPEAANWQYYVRRGSVGDMRPDNDKYGRLIQVWQRLPVGITKLVGPMIVRGIP